MDGMPMELDRVLMIWIKIKEELKSKLIII